jgi:glycosyltransferase involved in cell wall biosynthesis
MRKVLIITYYWPPSGGAGVQRMLKFVKYLRQFDIEPIVITVDENKASYQLTDKSLLNDIPRDTRIIKTNTFEPFEFYKLIGNKKEIPHSGFANETNPSFVQKMMRFIRGNFFIPDARKGWNKYAYKAALNILKTEKIDAIITSSPPHSSQLVGLKLKRKFGIPWIADMRDPWTDIYFYKQMLHTPIASRIDAKMEREVLEETDALIVVSQDIKRIFSNKSNKLDSNKIVVIPNGYDEADFSENVDTNASEFSITYTGTFADIYQIDAFLAAFRKIIDNHTDLNISLKFIGKVSGSLLQKTELLELQNHVSFGKYIPHKESVEALQKSTILLLVIPRMEKNEGILTGKLFEYLGSGKPIICIGPIHGDAASIITECNAGQTFDYEDEIGMYNYLDNLIILWKTEKLILNTNKNISGYSRKNLTKKLVEIIELIRN